MTPPEPVMAVRGLHVDYRLKDGWLSVIRDVSLTIHPQEIHGLVGESGSGKSTLALALLRYLAGNARITQGEIRFEGVDLCPLPDAQLRQLWGQALALVPQNPLAALNPSYPIGDQIAEAPRRHRSISRQQAYELALEWLRKVSIADPEQVARRYPHQLSGGQRQRVMIAMALVAQPRLLVLDEPTTALDVTTQAVILDLFRDLIRDHGAGALYVSHDLSTVAQFCDTVTVLYGGEVMESAPVDQLYHRPIHPYTYGLLASLPGHSTDHQTRLATIPGVAPSLAERPAGCVFAPRCRVAVELCHTAKPPLEAADDGRRVRCHRWREIADGSLPLAAPPPDYPSDTAPREGHILRARGLVRHFDDSHWLDRLTGRRPAPVRAVDGISLSIRPRSTFGLVGESGSGKTTLARVVVALETATAGELTLRDDTLSLDLRGRSPADLRAVQMVFQNPNDTLNPWLSVGEALTRTIRRLADPPIPRAQRRERAAQLLESVGLTAEYLRRYPAQLSGGEKQRVAIARAFAASPALVVADEPTSSLDVSVQAVVLNLLKDLRAREGVSYLLISHDLDVVAYLADWIGVMYLGQVVEEGTADDVYGTPSHPYTEALISAIPTPRVGERARRIRLSGDIPSARDVPTGCRFHTRCPRYLGDICRQQEPPWQDAGDGHRIRCHIPPGELTALQATPPPADPTERTV